MGNKGQAMVEFALMVLVFFMLVMAVVDLAMMFYVNLTMQHAVREGTRFVITGGQVSSNTDRRAVLIDKIKEFSNDLYDKNALESKDPTVSVLTPTNAAFSNYTGNPVDGSTGDPDQIIIVRLAYAWPLYTPMLYPFFKGGRYTFTASATMKNEHWSDFRSP